MPEPRDNALLAAVLDAQNAFITDIEPQTLFSGLLEKFLRLSGSEIGFLGEVLSPEWGTPYLKIRAMSDIVRNEEARRLFEEYLGKGLEFHNLGNLLGAAIATGRPVIAIDPATDPRADVLPAGHPALASYLGIPIMGATGMVGLVGLANRPGGFDESLVAELQPLTTTSARIIEAFRIDRQRRRVEKALLESVARSQRIFEHSGHGIELYDADGFLIDTNGACVQIFGVPDKQALLGFRLFDDPNLSDEMKAAVRAGEVLKFEMAFDFEKVKANRLYPTSRSGIARLDVNIIPLARESGSTLGYLVEIRDISARREAEEGLRKSLLEKEVLLREIHHRVKNNLQVISSLLSLQASGLEDPVVAEMFKESRDRIRTIALVHERLYRSGDLSRIDFGEYLRGLTGHLFQTHSVNPAKTRLVLDFAPVFLNIHTAVPLGLIVNELVTNALKHAFPGDRSGELRIAFGPASGDRLKLVAADDGVGLPEGLDIRRTASLGLQIITLLSDQLGGTLQVVSSPGAGARFEIVFPAGKNIAAD